MTCSFDNSYTTSQTVSFTNTNPCTESYAFSTTLTNDIVLAFTNIVIDCTNSNNNIQVVTSSNTVYSYCGNNTGNSFTFIGTKQQYAAVQRYGTVSGSVQIAFVASPANSCALSPCLNGGTCTSTGTTTFTCACQTGFYGATCQNGKLISKFLSIDSKYFNPLKITRHSTNCL